MFSCKMPGLCTSGAVHDEDEVHLPRENWRRLFREAGLETVEFYYPMPEYKPGSDQCIPTGIFPERAIFPM